MGVDWGYAGQVGGVGFGVVFLLLVILMVVVILVGTIVKKVETGKNQPNGGEKGE